MLAENSGVKSQTFLVTSESIEEALLEGALLAKEAIGTNGGQQVLALGSVDSSVPQYNAENLKPAVMIFKSAWQQNHCRYGRRSFAGSSL